MPKILEYPTASIKRSLRLAKAVDELGGSSSLDMCAERLGKKVSGGFREVIHSATKYNFLIQKKGILTITPLYKEIKLAYNEKEAENLKQKAFLNVPLFQKIYDRFKGQKLPVDIFDKLLIKEFNVSERMASRVEKYFIEGAKEIGLLTSDNMVIASAETCNKPTDEDSESQFDKLESETTNFEKQAYSSPQGSYSVKIFGPGMNSTISIMEEEDLEIVEKMLAKIKKKLHEKQDS
jgi:hypothetical protein